MRRSWQTTRGPFLFVVRERPRRLRRSCEENQSDAGDPELGRFGLTSKRSNWSEHDDCCSESSGLCPGQTDLPRTAHSLTRYRADDIFRNTQLCVY